MKISTLCFLIKDGRIALANKKRGFGKDKPNGYGGKISEDESEKIIAATVREVLEESGSKVEEGDLEKVAVNAFFFEEILVFETHIFFARKWEGEPKETEEMGPPQWFPLTDIPYDKMWASDKDWLPLALSGKRFKAMFIYDRNGTEVKDFQWEEETSR